MTIDIEPIVFTAVDAAVCDAFPNVFTTGEYVRQPPSLPALILEEKDNHPDERYSDSGGVENAVRVFYELSVYADSKSECKEIADVANETLQRMGFVRKYRGLVANEDDGIKRMLLRYEAGVTRDKQIYR